MNRQAVHDDFLKSMSKAANAKMVKDLLSKKDFVIRDDLKSDYLSSITYYHLKDGSILTLVADSKSRGWLYDSEEELLQFQRSFVSESMSRPILDPKFDFSSFIRLEGKEKLEKLSLSFGIELYKFDFSLKTAKLIDKNIKEGSIQLDSLLRDKFPYLLLFVGEVLLNVHGGNWYLEKDQDTSLLNPLIEIEGKKTNFYVELYETIMEKPKRYRTYSFIKSYDNIADGSF